MERDGRSGVSGMDELFLSRQPGRSGVRGDTVEVWVGGDAAVGYAGADDHAVRFSRLGEGGRRGDGPAEGAVPPDLLLGQTTRHILASPSLVPAKSGLGKTMVFW